MLDVIIFVFFLPGKHLACNKLPEVFMDILGHLAYLVLTLKIDQ